MMGSLGYDEIMGINVDFSFLDYSAGRSMIVNMEGERFFNEEDYLRLKDSYILTPDKLYNAKEDLSILHPLPRVNEISVAVDKDPRAAYWKQVKNGKFIRMALIMKLLDIRV